MGDKMAASPKTENDDLIIIIIIIITDYESS